MAIEFPSKPDVLDPIDLDARLAALEDPQFAERLQRENPELFPPDPPRTQRELLAWTTRRWGRALIAVTAALSLAAGYLGNELAHRPGAGPRSAPQPATVVVPLRHAAPVTHRDAPRPPAHAAVIVAPHAAALPHGASAPVQHHAAAPVQRHASAPVQHHAAAPVQLHARARVQHHVSAPVQRHASASQSAAAQLAAWEAANPASHARTSPSAATEPAPRTRPRTEPDAAATTTTTTAATTGPAAGTGSTGSAPEPNPGGVKAPPTSPGEIWNERLPGGGTLGGVIGPVIGVPRDSCTPRGGRTGIVMEAISVLTSRH
jgi:hypothetical protein